MGNSCACIDRFKPVLDSEASSKSSLRVEDSRVTIEFEVVEIEDKHIRCECISPREGKISQFRKSMIENQYLIRVKTGDILNVTYRNSKGYLDNIHHIHILPSHNDVSIPQNRHFNHTNHYEKLNPRDEHNLISAQNKNLQPEQHSLHTDIRTTGIEYENTIISPKRNQKDEQSFPDQDLATVKIEYEETIISPKRNQKDEQSFPDQDLATVKIEYEETIISPKRNQKDEQSFPDQDLATVKIEYEETIISPKSNQKDLQLDPDYSEADNHSTELYYAETILAPPNKRADILQHTYIYEDLLTLELSLTFKSHTHEEIDNSLDSQDIDLPLSPLPFIDCSGDSTIDSNLSTPRILSRIDSYRFDSKSPVIPPFSSLEPEVLQERFSTSSIEESVPRYSFPLPRATRTSSQDFPFFSRNSYTGSKPEADSYASLIAYRDDIHSPISTLGYKKLPINSLKLIYYFNTEVKFRIDALKQKYSGWRRVRSDGNCFYRAIGVSYYEHLIRTTATISEFLRYLGLMTQSNHLHVFNIDKQFYDYHHDQLSVVYRMKENKDKKIYSFLQGLFQDVNFDMGMVSEMRRITAKWIIKQANGPKISELGICLDEYLQNILTWGKEASGTEHHFLREALQVEINHVFVCDVDRIDNAISKRDNAVMLHVLHKQGEYDILYTYEQGWEDGKGF